MYCDCAPTILSLPWIPETFFRVCILRIFSFAICRNKMYLKHIPTFKPTLMINDTDYDIDNT